MTNDILIVVRKGMAECYCHESDNIRAFIVDVDSIERGDPALILPASTKIKQLVKQAKVQRYVDWC